MRLSLTWKFLFAFLLVTIIMAVLVTLFVRRTNVLQFRQLLLSQQITDLRVDLENYYAENNSWERVGLFIRERAGDSVQPPPNNNQQPGVAPRNAQFGVVNIDGRVLVPLRPFEVGERVPNNELRKAEPIVVAGETVGYIIIAEATLGLTEEEVAYLERTNQAVLFAAGISIIVAVLLGGLLTRTLVRPLRDLTPATEAMAQGELEQMVTVRSKDELGQLAHSFNQMSADVSKANQMRRQMTADIAHDLRTPLQVIAGYIESMQDGVLQATPERLSTIYTEIEHLQNLVGDLQTLSRADAGELSLNLQSLAPAALLKRIAQTYQQRAHKQAVELQIEAPEGLPLLQVDEERMVQVLGNIISNALRYTPVNGRIQLTAAAADGRIQLTISDTGSGIAPEAVPHIFDRFYRA
ncbi:MAG: HAMP domain-containing protein, partial [Anaerolineales bacterium]|nr:HAMP domain-containing protein [Anaerolineales bacterium]